jgi:UDP-glucose 4-epimerase
MILVTGGAGYIGSHIVDLLKDQKVMVLDDFSNADFAIVDRLNARRASKVSVVEGSINDQPVLDYAFNHRGIKAVIHCAGLKSVAESNRKKTAYTRVNVHGTIDVMAAAINSGVKTFIFSSSASVYAPSTDMSALTELSPTGPLSHYGVTKLEAEKAIFRLPVEYDSNIRVCALRYFNPIGAFPFRDRSPSNLVPALCNAT